MPPLRSIGHVHGACLPSAAAPSAGMKKHVGVLEQAGLVTTEKVGRVRTCTLGVRRLEEAAAWIERYHHLWSARFEALDTVIEALKRKEEVDGRKQRN